MNLNTASCLLPVQRRNDWAQPHLTYVPKTWYQSAFRLSQNALFRLFASRK